MCAYSIEMVRARKLYRNVRMQSEQDTLTVNHNLLGIRKLSIPSVKPSPQGVPNQQANLAKRRFSHVGLVARRMSIAPTKQGPSPEVMIVGRALTGLYLRSRLKRAGLFSRRPGLGSGAAGVAPIVKDVYPSLMCAATELERMHPRVFSNVVRQVGARYSNDKDKDDIDEAAIFLAVAHQVLNTDTWGSVIAVFCVAGALTVECARHGHSDNIDGILDAMSEFLEDRLALWVSQHGGWLALTKRCRLRRTRSRLSMPLPLSLPSSPTLMIFVPVCMVALMALFLFSIYF